MESWGVADCEVWMGWWKCLLGNFADGSLSEVWVGWRHALFGLVCLLDLKSGVFGLHLSYDMLYP